jgi:hypothetical protein
MTTCTCSSQRRDRLHFRADRFGDDLLWYRHTFNLSQLTKQNFVIRLLIDIMHIHITDDARPIDDEERPLTFTIGAQHTILFCYLPMGPEIRQKRIRNTTKAFRPGVQTIFTVYGDTQDLGIYPLEPV